MPATANERVRVMRGRIEGDGSPNGRRWALRVRVRVRKARSWVLGYRPEPLRSEPGKIGGRFSAPLIRADLPRSPNVCSLPLFASSTPPVTNKSVARRLKLTADLIELTGGNPFRARAFSSGARAIERLDVSLDRLVAEDALTSVQGIGKGLAADIRELLATGELAITERLLQALPPGLPDVLRVRGLGVKKVRTLWTEAGVTSLDELEAAAASGRLAQLDGFGAKTVQNILASVEELRAYQGQAHLRDAYREAVAIRQALRDAGLRTELAGAVRRQCNVVDAVDLVSAGAAASIASALTALGLTVTAVEASVNMSTPLGLPVRIWLSTDAAFGQTLFECTGPEEHLTAFRTTHGDPIETDDEDEVYRAAGLYPVPPPLRDLPDALTWAATDSLPELVTSAALRGTVHNHTTWSDGAHSLREMAEAARARGLTYFGVCDHSRSLQIAHGLSIDQLEAQRAEIDATQRRVRLGRHRLPHLRRLRGGHSLGWLHGLPGCGAGWTRAGGGKRSHWVPDECGRGHSSTHRSSLESVCGHSWPPDRAPAPPPKGLPHRR